MAMMVVLQPTEREPRLDGSSLDMLRQLGVTSVELLRDEGSFGLVLDGWAFDPARSRDAAVAALGAGPVARTLLPLVHMAVNDSTGGS